MKRRFYTDDELAYIATFYEHDGPELMAAAVNRSYKSIQQIVHRMRQNGTYQHYQNLWKSNDVNTERR
jgi:hypothetical protein